MRVRIICQRRRILISRCETFVSYKDESRHEIMPPDTEHRWTELGSEHSYRGRKLTDNKTISPAKVHAAIHTVRVPLRMLEKDTFQAALGLPVLRNKLVTADAGSVWFTHDTLLASYCAQNPANCTCKITFKTCVASGLPSIMVSGNIGMHSLNGPKASHMEQVPHSVAFVQSYSSGDGERRRGGLDVDSAALPSNFNASSTSSLPAQGAVLAQAYQVLPDESSP